jgi:hypothetical protein
MHRWLQTQPKVNCPTVSYPQLTLICTFNLWTSWSPVTEFFVQVRWILIATQSDTDNWLHPSPPPSIHSELTYTSYNRAPEYCLLSKKWEKSKRIHKQFLYSASLGIPPCCGYAGDPPTQNKWYMTYNSVWILLLCKLFTCYWQFKVQVKLY